ncbi:MAG: aminotransferase class IV [Dehalococcoidia bacterium]|nr:aminotransferase class IV [Dehalococcoidia bacterium]
MEQVVYLDGSLLPRSRALISPFDFGFLYGYGLFETMRAYGGRIFRLSRHLDRLHASMQALGISAGGYNLKEACYDTVAANSLSEARIRLTVSLGESEGLDPPAQPKITVFIVATKYRPPAGHVYATGYRARTASIRRYSGSALSRLKSLNYLDSLLARSEARREGADEAILLNEKGFLCEGSTTNVFLISGGALLTPPESAGCLPGITREAVVGLACTLGIPVFERELSPDELSVADEVFLTNSLLEIMPVKDIDGKPIGCAGAKGAGQVTQRLMEAYRALVAAEFTSLP